MGTGTGMGTSEKVKQGLAGNCGELSAWGRCTGQVASACVAGQRVDVNCAASGRRCAITREGARCLARTAQDCEPDDAPRCDGDVLWHCFEGRWQSFDCARRLGRCDSLATARCVDTRDPGRGELRASQERCDGKDQDQDGTIDEGQVCDKVALVAFVSGEAARGDFSETLERERETLERVFAPLHFEWAKTVSASAPASFEPDALDQEARKLARAESRYERVTANQSTGAAPQTEDIGLDFYIPVLFVDEIDTDPPITGISALPNASCGGVRISDRTAPIEGLIVVAARRTALTLAHELGHYLGLCHTHDEITAYGADTRTALECAVTGDGLCDTPWDPGPEQCALREDCSPLCAGTPAAPDTRNVMSYYMPCRDGLSLEQHAVVEHNLALRRGWFRCQNPASCPCSVGGERTCPEAMSCQPASERGTGFCLLDGASLPGAPCDDVADCSLGGICLGADTGGRPRNARCVRPCQDACQCSDVGLAFQVCAEDLEERR